MKVVFRADASIEIGAGHVMRCLTLADELRKQGVECTFICRQHAGNLIGAIVNRGHKAMALPASTTEKISNKDNVVHSKWLGADWQTDAAETIQALDGDLIDWLIVDHYAIDSRWERLLRPYCNKMMVIDDLADRHHDCDLLLDQNLGRNKGDYNSLVPDDAKVLIGPGYALLRPEFAQYREKSLQRRKNPQLNHLLISMGGMDKDNYTGRVLDVINRCNLPNHLQVTVVMGAQAPNLRKVKAQAEDMICDTQVVVDVENMAQLMADSDLAIGAAGSTSWERCCLGLPTIQFVVAENQQLISDALDTASAARVATHQLFRSVLNEILDNSYQLSILSLMSQSAQQITDGSGVSLVSEMIN